MNATGTLVYCIDAYCTMSGIQRMVPHRSFSSASKPTNVQAAQMANEVFQQMNTLLRTLGYAVPVSSGASESIGYLKRMNTLGAAAAWEDAAYSGGNEGRSEYGTVMRDQFNLLWKDLRDGRIRLNDATESEDHPTGRQGTGGYAFDDGGTGTEAGSLFTKSTVF